MATGPLDWLAEFHRIVTDGRQLGIHVVLAAVRPEECAEWRAGEIEPVASLSLAASPDAAGQAIERAVDTAKRITARGGDVVVLIDGLDSIAPHAARRALEVEPHHVPDLERVYTLFVSLRAWNDAVRALELKVQVHLAAEEREQAVVLHPLR